MVQRNQISLEIDELIESIDLKAIDRSKLYRFEILLNTYKELLELDIELNFMIENTIKLQKKISDFIWVMFFVEIFILIFCLFFLKTRFSYVI